MSLVLICSFAVTGQVDEKRFEIGGQFSVLRRGIPTRPRPIFVIPTGLPQFEFDGVNRYGFGGRLTYNLNRSVAVEGEGNVFMVSDRDRYQRATGGTFYQGQFGIKAGKRFSKFGIFAKARPGFINVNAPKVTVTTINFGNGTVMGISDTPNRSTFFSADLGGVLEFYPSKRIMARVDVGDTIIDFPGATPPPVVPPNFFIPGRPDVQKHNLQVSVGLGYRF